MTTRRRFIGVSGLAGAGLLLPWKGLVRNARAQIPGGTLAPGDVSKFVTPLVKPPAMPGKFRKNKDLFKIAMRQFRQHILPDTMGLPMTPVWSYGPADARHTDLASGYFYPAFTVEATANRTTQVLWRNQLIDPSTGNFLPHLLPVDPTLHWANPPGGLAGRDRRPSFTTTPGPYTGPVPMITHVHGGHTREDSDGYPEAWYLPEANNIPAGYAQTGTFFDYFNAKYGHNWSPGTAAFKYDNDQPAATLWYHDHALGMTRENVYAGPAGFWLVRGGPNDLDLGYVAPGVGDSPVGEYTEIPIVIQDRSFNADGSLFYPDSRAFFEGLDPAQLTIPFIPGTACDGLPSDVSPIWNPEFFGNMMVVNGRTWPELEVERRRYRFRFLNGCNSRFLILKADNGMPFYQIGADQGFLPETAELNQLLMAPAERADVIMDFTGLPVGTEIILQNLGPDEPFGGGVPGIDFDPSDPASTGQVMRFRVKAASNGDTTDHPLDLDLKAAAAKPLGSATATQDVSLNEEESASVRASDGAFDCANGEAFGPTAALLGTVNPDDTGNPMLWSGPITENPALGSTEEWTIHNYTEDAHPIHVHLVQFQVVGREPIEGGLSVAGKNDPLPSETGFKDTVIAYPGEVTRIKAKYDKPGLFVWHCHILEHEDNEMMRPYHVGPIDPNAPLPDNQP